MRGSDGLQLGRCRHPVDLLQVRGQRCHRRGVRGISFSWQSARAGTGKAARRRRSHSRQPGATPKGRAGRNRPAPRVYAAMTPYVSPLMVDAVPCAPPTDAAPRRTPARNSSDVRPGALVQVVPTRRNVCASLPRPRQNVRWAMRLPASAVRAAQRACFARRASRHYAPRAPALRRGCAGSGRAESVHDRSGADGSAQRPPRRRAAGQPRRKRCFAEAADRGAATRSCRRRRGAPRYRHRETGTTPLRR